MMLDFSCCSHISLQSLLLYWWGLSSTDFVFLKGVPFSCIFLIDMFDVFAGVNVILDTRRNLAWADRLVEDVMRDIEDASRTSRSKQSGI